MGGGIRPEPILIEKWHHIIWNLEFSESLRPESIGQDAWAPVFANLAQNIGETFEQYVGTLADSMTHHAAFGQRTIDPAQLFAFEISKAAAALHPIGTLAKSVDAAVPAPGLPLVFSRKFANGIVPRWRLGALGRGWVHNWEVYIQVLSNGDVVLRGPGGVERFFRFVGGEYYAPSPGDQGRLGLGGGAFRLTEADQTVWQFRADHQLDFVQDSNANRITLGYQDGQLTALTHSNRRQLLLAYDAQGRLWHLTDPLGPGADDDLVTTYEYDPVGEHLTTVIKPGGRVTRYGYITDAAPLSLQRRHALDSTEYPDLTHDYFEYDSQGRLSATYADGGAQRVEYRHDALGNVTVVDATERQIVLRYGLGGRLVQVEDGEARRADLSYNAAGQLASLVGPGRELYRYGYDARGNLDAINDPLRRTNRFSFEAAFNRLQTVTDARQNSIGYGYDIRGNLTSITYADRSAELFGYAASGLVLTSTNRRGNVITYGYNTAGQLTNRWWLTPTGRVDYAYLYNSAGALEFAIGPEGTNALTYYPETLRLRTITYPGGQGFTFEYDAAGKRTRRLDHDGHMVSYHHDTLGRLDRMTNGLGEPIVDYDYDSAGRLSRKTLGNGVYTVYTNDHSGQILSLYNYRADQTLLSSYHYGYDASGRRTSMQVAGPYPRLETYGYDPLGQLTAVTNWTADGFTMLSATTYRYDEAGNRTLVMRTGANPFTDSYAANELNQYTSAGDATFGYDADGNMTSKVEDGVETIYGYDTENRLVSVATPTDSWSYEYNALGNRVASTRNGETTRYVIDPIGLSNVAGEYDGGGNLLARYEHGFGLLSRSDAVGNPAYYTFSAIGHTSELSDRTGAIVNAYDLDPWGVSREQQQIVPNPFQFVGEFGVMQEPYELLMMRERHYSTRVGRFLQTDPLDVSGGMNLYEYVENHPNLFTDPRGTSPSSHESLQYDVDSGGTFKFPGRVIGAPESPWMKFVRSPWYDDYRFYWFRQDPGWANRLKQRVDDYNEGFFTLTTGLASLTLEAGLMGLLGAVDVTTGLSQFYAGLQPPAPPGSLQNQQSSTVVRARDPNDKLAPGGYDSAVFLPPDRSFAYRIRFENVQDATAPAQQVVVTDVLDEGFDLNTFELSEVTFANQSIPIPYGLSDYQTQFALIGTNATAACALVAGYPGAQVDWLNGCVLVDVAASLDRVTRTLTLRLDALDPLTGWWPEDPLVGLLPPNDNTGRGEGSISYVVRPKSGLPSGTRIENRARIVFDYNDPIDTPLVFNTIDAGRPSSQVTTLPEVTGSEDFLVSWSGEDDAGGSGIASYDVFVAVDDGPFGLWLERTEATSGTFSGESGRRYAFYSIARDNVGHTEDAPTVPDAVTRIVLSEGNRPPAARDDSVERERDAGVGVAIAKLLANDADPDGDALSLVAFDSLTPGGASVVEQAGYLLYTPPEGFNEPDSFTYTISDGNGGTASATVHVTVVGEPPANLHVIVIVPAAEGGFTITFAGIPRRSYAIEATSDIVQGPWEQVATRVAGADGAFEFTDVATHVMRFYRIVANP
jgi:RHS repeat-associated protein